MGQTPLGRQWPKGYEPTEEDFAQYRAYLQGILAQTQASRSVSLRTLGLVAVFVAVMALVWWLA